MISFQNKQNDLQTDKFNQRIIFTKLKKEIIYNENIILDSLYKSASKKMCQLI